MNRLYSAAIVLLALTSCSPSRSAPAVAAHPDSDVLGGCLQSTTVQLDGGPLNLTLEDARRIRVAVEEYLIAKKAKLDESVFWPGEVFIDCEGTVRMGMWVLEPADSDLRLAARIRTGGPGMLREEIRIRRVGEGWKAVGIARVIYHPAR